ncbi:hypothetical protein R1sor_011841 [Riccia sorocarpa]|uniref:Uncharacterized protein n=1 Tax=Riccia sorocarpa TaxID=122646 RepID=A0ABD3I5N7_9MARC
MLRTSLSPSCADIFVRIKCCKTSSLCGHETNELLHSSQKIGVHWRKFLNKTQQEWAPVLSLSSARPTLDDVERLSRGRASKAKIGSRAVPHRLNADERKAFELAKKRGFVVHQPSTRRYPLINSHRNYCDAVGIPCIRIEQGLGGQADEVVIDLTPLRLPEIDLQTFRGEIIKVVESRDSDGSRTSNSSVAEETKEKSAPDEVVDNGEDELANSHTSADSSPDVDFKPLRFQTSSRSEARAIADSVVQVWKTWSRSNLSVPA